MRRRSMPSSVKFKKSLEIVLKSEGGYVDNAFDHGGPTNCGITQDTLAKFMGKPASAEDVRNLFPYQVEDIYWALYWNPLGLEGVEDWRLCAMIFDQAVNRGISTVVRQIQEIVKVEVDGFMGPATIGGINFQAPNKLAIDFLKAAQLAYAQIVKRSPGQAVFLVGWISRTHRLLDLLF